MHTLLQVGERNLLNKSDFSKQQSPKYMPIRKCSHCTRLWYMGERGTRCKEGDGTCQVPSKCLEVLDFS